MIYFIPIMIFDSTVYRTYFRGISFAGAYSFLSLIIAYYTFNATKNDSYLSVIGYVMIANFLISCCYLIYVLHTFKPHRPDVES